MKAAEDRGLVCLSSSRLCTYLNKHETFEYRYFRRDAYYDALALDEIFDMLSDLDGQVDLGRSERGARHLSRRVVGRSLKWRVAIRLTEA